MHGDLSLLPYRKKELKRSRSVDMPSLAVANGHAAQISGGPRLESHQPLRPTTEKRPAPAEGRDRAAFNNGCCNETFRSG